MEKKEVNEQQEYSPDSSLGDEGVQSAKQVVNTFVLAWKNYGLYPEDHVTTVNSLNNLASAFTSHLEQYGDFRITVEKDHLLCGNETIYQVSHEAPQEDITTLLYRDGIKWIEFQDGLPLEEISSLFRIAFKYRLFLEETEGDIVTALMDEELEFIDFKAVDIFWQDLLLMDFASLPPPEPPPEKSPETDETEDTGEEEEVSSVSISARSIADPAIDESLLELSSDESVTLQQMVRDEEAWDISEDLVEALTIVLKSQDEPDKFETVLDFISELAVDTMEMDRFDLLVKLFQALHKLYSSEASDEKSWKTPLIYRFFQQLSTPENFQLISEKMLQVDTSKVSELKALGKALHYFSAGIIPFLVPVIAQRNANEIQQMVSDIIVKKSQRDLGPLEQIAKEHGREIGDRLLDILARLPDERVNNIIYGLSSHPTDRVRVKAIRELVDRDPKYVNKLFSLIDDPSKEIRTSIMDAVALHKTKLLENLLLNYLKANLTKKEPEHIQACFETIGRCGTNTSVPFLRKMLLEREWNTFMGSGKPLYREGAAKALAQIDTPQAQDALQKASTSKFKVIRHAYENTLNPGEAAGENSHE